MLCYKEVELQQFESVKQKLLSTAIEICKENPNRLVSDILHPDIFFKKSKSLKDELEEKFGLINAVVVFNIGHSNKYLMGENSIHRDSPKYKNCRLNLPLLNGDSVETRFYNLKKDGADPRLTNNKKSEWKPLESYHLKDCEQIDKLELTKPVIFNIKSIHSLYHIPNKPLPRIICSIEFKSDLLMRSFLQ